MKNPKRPPLENKGQAALDGAMKDNLSINVEADMGASKGPDAPNMTEGFSPGSLNHSPEMEAMMKDSGMGSMMGDMDRDYD